MDPGRRERAGAHVPRHVLLLRHRRPGVPARREQRVRNAVSRRVHRLLRLLLRRHLELRARSVVQTDAEADHHRTGSEARDERRGDEPRVSGERGGRVRRGIRVLARRFVRAGGDGKLRLGASVRGAVAGVGDRYRVRVGRFADGLVARRDGSVQRVL